MNEIMSSPAPFILFLVVVGIIFCYVFRPLG